jgi:tRNA(Arg) A34 adenosine deaminase TadA
MPADTDHLRTAIDCAEASPDGHPYGAVLVRDGTVLQQAENTVPTGGITAHPELKLARWSADALAPEARAECTMYASTEPCEMCATAIGYAGIGRVVFSVTRATLASRTGDAAGVPCRELLDRKEAPTAVEGPVLQEEGLVVHD